MNAIFICVIVLDKMCFHMLNLCWFKHKKIFECFRCFWKVFLSQKKKWKFQKQCCPVLVTHGSFKLHATVASSQVGFGNLFMSGRSSHEGYTEIFMAQLVTPSRVRPSIVENTFGLKCFGRWPWRLIGDLLQSQKTCVLHSKGSF